MKQANSKNEPLVFLHGACTSKNMWQQQRDVLGEDHEVICLDLPLHGEHRDVTGAYTIESLANSVVQKLDSLGVTQCHISGHSLGGMVAQQIAVDHPERVKKLVLAESAFGTKNSIWERAQTAFALIFLKLMSARAITNLTAKQYGSLNKNVRDYLAAEMGTFSHDEIMRIMGAAFGFAGRSQLENIKAPTLILVGQNNKQTHAQGRIMAQSIPTATIEIIPDASHMLNMDNPEAFNQALSTFLTLGRN